MNNLIRTLVLAPAVLMTGAAFAAQNTTVNVPFSFTSQGKSYPAGQYIVSVNSGNQFARLSARTQPFNSIMSNLRPSDGNPNDSIKTRLEFSASSHELLKIKHGVYSSPDLATDRSGRRVVETSAIENTSKAGAGK